jgi:ABC-type lipoprotein release transport system permease subunit
MLTLSSLPPRSLRYHWTSAVPVLLGVAVGAAVLTGALLVGDSLRGSLRARTEKQLNGITSAYLGVRMVRQEAAEKLTGATSALLLTGSARTQTDSGEKRLGHITVFGLNDAPDQRFDLPPGVVVSHRVAERLNLKVGSDLTLGLEKGSRVPRSSLVGKRDAEDVTASVKVKVAIVLPPDHPMNEFNLTPNPTPPLNLFVSLSLLQQRLDLPGKVNAIFSRDADAAALNQKLHADLTLADWGLHILPGDKPDSKLRADALARQRYVLVESENSILDSATVAAIENAAKSLGLRSERTLAYLANGIYAGTESIPNDAKTTKTPLMGYAIVAAVDPNAPAPLGPFLPDGVSQLKDDEIALLNWPDSPLKNLKPGDPLTVAYFKPEMEAKVEEAWHTFRFAGSVPFAGPTPFALPADDPNLTPPFPGVTDKPKIRQWEAPFDVNYARVTPADDEFWERHQATPKAYITRTTGEKLFGSRFGSVTSIRIAPANGKTAEQTAEVLRAELRKQLDPAAAGFTVEPIRERMLAASQGGTDFGAMLLAFSFLLIVAALLLVGLLFRLAIDRRAKEVGLLLATGYSPKQVTRLLLIEGLLVSVVGSLIGGALAVGYAKLMLGVLAALWPDAQVQNYLTLHITPLSLAIGFVLTVLVAMAAIWFGVRELVKVPPPALLRGETSVPELVAKPVRLRRSLILAVMCAVVGVGLVSGGTLATNPDQRAGTFFGGGLLLMAAGVLAFRVWLVRPMHHLIGDVTALGIRNTTRAASRSLLTVSLLALATFLLVAVESFRKRPGDEFATETGGSGGFRLLGETDVPVFHRLDDTRGRNDLLDELQKMYQDGTGDVQAQRNMAEADLKQLTVLPFRLRGGDDASCLNLYQAGRPRMVGVPDDLLAKRRFAFAMTEATTPEEKANPWLLLAKPTADGSIPVIVEINTALWMLKTFLGGTIPMPDESGREVKLRVVGLLQDSVFQSELLVSDSNFRKLYPREEGFRLFLINAPADKIDRTTELLETGLRANGLTVAKTADRVATYQSVIGAYLTTFQLLGGLGLLLGVFGLGAVMLRAVWERAGELALLRAVGYATLMLQRLVLVENVVLLAVGVGVGVIAAMISVVPNLVLGGQIGSVRLAVMLAAVIVVGLLVAVMTTRSVARAPLIPALRKD